MRNRRFKFRNRRQHKGAPSVPQKDSNGAAIDECRRKTADRRIDSIQAALVNLNS